MTDNILLSFCKPVSTPLEDLYVVAVTTGYRLPIIGERKHDAVSPLWPQMHQNCHDAASLSDTALVSGTQFLVPRFSFSQEKNTYFSAELGSKKIWIIFLKTKALSQVGSDWLCPCQSQTVFHSKSMLDMFSCYKFVHLEYFPSFFVVPNE